MKVSELRALKASNSRIHVALEGRYISVIRGIHGKLYAIDSVCYHMGGPLTIGDIEDVNGRECVRCPWHHYPVVLEDGSKLYQAMEFKGGKLQPAGWKATEKRQRVHDVEEREDGIYVRLTSLEDVGRQCTDGEFESDRWAFNEDAAMNCLRPGSNSGADGKAKFRSGDGVHHSKVKKDEALQAVKGGRKFLPGTVKGNVGNSRFKRSGEVLAAQRMKSRASGLDSERVPVAKQYHIMHATKFLPFYLLSRRKISKSMVLYSFLLEPSSTLGVKTVERHVQVRGVSKSGEVVVREYTPVSHASVKGKFDLAVKLYPNGKMSRIFNRLQVGESIEMRGLFGDVSIEMPEFEDFVRVGRGKHFRSNFKELKRISMVAGGSGITPMLQILRCDAARLCDVKFRLLFANKSFADIPFFSELMQLSRDNKNIDIVFIISHGPMPENVQHDCNLHVGRIGFKEMKEFLFPPDSVSGLLVCGPEEFEQSVSAIGTEIGFLKENIYFF